MKGMTIIWLVVFGVCVFVIGFLTHKFITDDSRRAPPAYLERLTGDLGLSEDQQDAVRKLLSEQDRRMEALKDSEPGKAFLERMNEIRRDTQNRIENVLDENQKKEWKSLLSGSGSPDGGTGPAK